MTAPAKYAVPSDRQVAEVWRNDRQTADIIRQAQESDEADRQLTILQALSKYRKAVFWAMFLSTSLIMEGYDLVIVSSQFLISIIVKAEFSKITSFYGQTQFKDKFGVYDPSSGQKLIPAAWQSGLSNSALVGQLAGLVANAVCQDRFGCRPTMMFFLGWMAVAIFVPVFTPSLSVLAFGEVFCGIPWGVFQV